MSKAHDQRLINLVDERKVLLDASNQIRDDIRSYERLCQDISAHSTSYTQSQVADLQK